MIWRNGAEPLHPNRPLINFPALDESQVLFFIFSWYDSYDIYRYSTLHPSYDISAIPNPREPNRIIHHQNTNQDMISG